MERPAVPDPTAAASAAWVCKVPRLGVCVGAAGRRQRCAQTDCRPGRLTGRWAAAGHNRVRPGDPGPPSDRRGPFRRSAGVRLAFRRSVETWLVIRRSASALPGVRKLVRTLIAVRRSAGALPGVRRSVWARSDRNYGFQREGFQRSPSVERPLDGQQLRNQLNRHEHPQPVTPADRRRPADGDMGIDYPNGQPF